MLGTLPNAPGRSHGIQKGTRFSAIRGARASSIAENVKHLPTLNHQDLMLSGQGSGPSGCPPGWALGGPLQEAPSPGAESGRADGELGQVTLCFYWESPEKHF